jgi:hypothetical protein
MKRQPWLVFFGAAVLTVAIAADEQEAAALGGFISGLGLGEHVTLKLTEEELDLPTLRSFAANDLDYYLSETGISVGARSKITRALQSPGATTTSSIELSPLAEVRRLGALQQNAGWNTTRLKALLLDGYDHTVPPKGAQVYVQYAVNHVEALSTVDQSLSLVGWWRSYWTDSRLTWDADVWGVDMLTFVSSGEWKQVWVPDITVINADHSARSNEVTVSEVTVYASGDIFVSVPLAQKIPCDMDLTHFPFDTQICDFTIGSWSYHGYMVDVKPRIVAGAPSAIDITGLTELEEFAVSKIVARYYDTFYQCCAEPYPVIKFSFHFVREPYPYLSGIIFPLILITNTGFLAFAVNPDAGERISLGITVMLTTQAIFITARDDIPKNGQLTAMSTLYSISFTFSTLTLIISIICVSLYLVRPSTGKYSVKNMLGVFTEADKNNNGLLDEEETIDAIARLGVHSADTHMITQYVSEALKDKDDLNFLDWYEIVDKLSVSDGLASHHNVMISTIVNFFARREHEARRASARRRIAAVSHKHEIARNLKLTRRRSSRDFSTEISAEALVSDITEPSQNDHFVRCEIINEDDDNKDNNGDDSDMVSGLHIHHQHIKKKETRPAVVSSNDVKDFLDQQDQNGINALMHESELEDPSEKIGRDVAATLDKIASILMPLAYLTVCVALLAGQNFETGVAGCEVLTLGEPA